MLNKINGITLKTNRSNKIPFWKYFLMIAFLPYGLYYFIFKSKVKWFVKIPLSIIIMVILIVAIDQKVNPYRVEDKLVNDTIQSFMTKQNKEKVGVVKSIKREGEFIWKKKTYIVYRTSTTKNLYDFVVTVDKKDSYKVSGIYQTYPVSKWDEELSDNMLPAPPMAMLYFYEQKEKIGNVKTVTMIDGNNIVDTTKGKYKFVFEKNKVVLIEKENGQIVLQQKNEYSLPKEAIKYFKKHKNGIGELLEVYSFELDDKKEMFFVKTTKGIYRVDDYRNGHIKLLKQNEE